jgi:predicted nuclease of predicted toxin-antitoxin system
MKFIIDAQLPPALADWLRGKGHEAVAVREIGLLDADDNAIWAHAVENQATIVTKDEDFAIRAATQDGPPILWVRTGNLVNRLLLARFEVAWPRIEAHFESAARVVELR